MNVMVKLSINTRIKLNNGVEIPILGFGSFLLNESRNTVNVILKALEAGYRLIDTAEIYGNEQSIGLAIKESGIPRDEIFITTKLGNLSHGFASTIKAFNRSLKKLNLTYIDLYLIHWPIENIRLESWKALEKIIEEGKSRAIGVSNYMIWHLKELLENSSTIPTVDQVEFSPYTYQKDLLQFCNSNNIQLESYSPLTKGTKLNDPKLIDIALKYNKTPAQILIRWVLQKGVVVIPKSSKKERIFENANVFDFQISTQDIKKLDSFNQNLRTGWDPSTTI
jgi:diketogulonate reductase-like aldo/keto reductase